MYLDDMYTYKKKLGQLPQMCRFTIWGLLSWYQSGGLGDSSKLRSLEPKPCARGRDSDDNPGLDHSAMDARLVTMHLVEGIEPN